MKAPRRVHLRLWSAPAPQPGAGPQRTDCPHHAACAGVAEGERYAAWTCAACEMPADCAPDQIVMLEHPQVHRLAQVAQIRSMNCGYYDLCCSEAARRKWHGWNCAACPQRDRPRTRPPRPVDPATAEVISRMVGVSRQAVLQREQTALMKIRDRLRRMAG